MATLVEIIAGLFGILIAAFLAVAGIVLLALAVAKFGWLPILVCLIAFVCAYAFLTAARS